MYPRAVSDVIGTVVRTVLARSRARLAAVERRTWGWIGLWGGVAIVYVVMVVAFERGIRPAPPAWFVDARYGPLYWDRVMGVCGVVGASAFRRAHVCRPP